MTNTQYTNTWDSQYMPCVLRVDAIPPAESRSASISSRYSYDNTGQRYNVTRIVNPDSTFNEEAYRNYSPLYLSTTFAVTYGLSFASITATLTHAFLYFRKHIWKQARRSMSEEPDCHARLMMRYRQVPELWYLCLFCRLLFFLEGRYLDFDGFFSDYVRVWGYLHCGLGH